MCRSGSCCVQVQTTNTPVGFTARPTDPQSALSCVPQRAAAETEHDMFVEIPALFHTDSRLLVLTDAAVNATDTNSLLDLFLHFIFPGDFRISRDSSPAPLI